MYDVSLLYTYVQHLTFYIQNITYDYTVLLYIVFWAQRGS